MQVGKIRRETKTYRTLEGRIGKITTIYKKRCWGGIPATGICNWMACRNINR